MRVHGVELNPDGDMVIYHMRRMGQEQFEPDSMRAWLDAVRPGVTAVDVGAYTGLYAIAAAQAGADAVAFEPNPYAHARMMENIEANGVVVTTFRSAAGREAADAQFGMSRPLTSAGAIGVTGGAEIQVRVMALDAARLEGVAAIKIDVEGSEIDVLKGALETIRKTHPLVITEALTDDSRQELEAFMAAEGYTAMPADERNLIFRHTL